MNTFLNEKTLKVGFIGNYIPLQGVQYIIEAAQNLRSDAIEFELIGNGQTYDQMRLLAKELALTNVTFKDRVPYSDLPNLYKGFDIVLGIFGDTDKATRVIPNKVFEAAAMARPIISADTKAMRELFTHEKDIILCKRADSSSLSEAIRDLARNTEKRHKIGRNTLITYELNASPNIIGKELVSVFKKVMMR